MPTDPLPEGERPAPPAPPAPVDPVQPEATHTVMVKLFRGYGEHRPECTCGWTGSYWPLRSTAELEAAKHLREPDA